ncbi:NUDIX hydrolase [Mycolicibacterium aubagnense]|uniref:DNA mismatch repair protein MutT n=1 Tax=Mycolicibacterium aubagnense TaxID=319707 RepID=A0ABM7IK17_9MYCO|nr:NUDIX domain-containing protein [Mycolicibacterium aubagnense]TLH66310.1 DNA mismatch repair protein MutT [Mycolicibacterium aubagnense]WGI31438.1 NUDIX domain-containing protein [Mycolicibacterium aubagnense]BBX87120.1 DNA mismatch repair protein MutT [Mycolicibacterium aubagnense]
MTVIRIVAAVVVDERGWLLVVRKRGTTAFMQPGGKLEPGESAVDALAREVREELGVGVTDVRELGHHTAIAANEPGHTVDAELFSVRLDGVPQIAAEIEEMAWIDPHAPGDIELAPLTRDTVLEFARVS